MQPPAGLDPLLGGGLLVHDGFLDRAEVGSLRECAQLRGARGEFRAAGIGAAAERRGELRGDSICWLAAPLFAAERGLLTAFEVLRYAVNREAMLGLFDLELHYALYPPGSGYVRHLDQPRGREQRRVSLALYLNEQWEPEDGGALRVHDAAGSHRDVAPCGGRLVMFLTAGRVHEVLPARRPRLSLSGWFRARD
jgi:SM-20-related protein